MSSKPGRIFHESTTTIGCTVSLSTNFLWVGHASSCQEIYTRLLLSITSWKGAEEEKLLLLVGVVVPLLCMSVRALTKLLIWPVTNLLEPTIYEKYNFYLNGKVLFLKVGWVNNSNNFFALMWYMNHIMYIS